MKTPPPVLNNYPVIGFLPCVSNGEPNGGFIVLVQRKLSVWVTTGMPLGRYVTAYWRERCEDTWMSGNYDMTLEDALQDMVDRALDQ